MANRQTKAEINRKVLSMKERLEVWRLKLDQETDNKRILEIKGIINELDDTITGMERL